MKTRFLLISALLVSALMGCSKESNDMIDEAVNPKEANFSIFVKGENTKTTNSGMSTLWASGDKINVFHAEAGSTTYVNDHDFITSESSSTATFSGTLGEALTAAKYDWYAFYPHNSNITTPSGPTWSTTIGSASNGYQSQTNYGTTAHICGDNYPIAGKAVNVNKADSPQITMSHVSSLLKIHITNNSGSDVTISSIGFVAPTDIIGDYKISFNGNSPSFVARGSSYVSKTAKLSITGGTAISNGSSEDFYLAVKPFTADEDSEIRIVVNNVQKTMTVPAGGYTFTHGKMKTINLSYEKPSYDQLVYIPLGISGNAYTDWSNVPGTKSSAVYAGHSFPNDNNYIQIKNGSPSGIISTTSGGCINKITVKWNSATTDGRSVSIYGKNSPFTSSADLYDENTRGTLIGTIAKGTSTEVSATNYFEYIGIVASGALYMDEVGVYWGDAKTRVAAPTNVNASVSGTTINVTWTDVAFNVGSYIVTCTDQEPQVISQGTQSASFTSLPNGTYNITVQAVPSDVTLATGTKAYSDVVSTTATVTAAVTEVWKETALSSIGSSDVFVIVGTKDGGSTYFVMPNNNGTTAPPATSITITTSGSDKVVSGNVLDIWKWNVSVTSGLYTFYPNGDHTKWLYFTNTNNGVKVGTGEAKAFTYESSKLQYTFDATTRILSVYNTQDWRCYTSGASNVVVSFFVLQP